MRETEESAAPRGHSWTWLGWLDAVTLAGEVGGCSSCLHEGSRASGQGTGPVWGVWPLTRSPATELKLTVLALAGQFSPSW